MDRCAKGQLLTDLTPDPLPAELAPFVAQAQDRFEQATDGLAPEAAIQHLEAAVARAAVEASRLGLQIPSPDPADALGLVEGQAPVVVIQRLAAPGTSS